MIDLLWMSDLFQEAHGLIEIRCFDVTGASKPFIRYCSDLETACDILCAIDAKDGWNVYVGMATRVRKAGRKEDCWASRVLWVDFDFDTMPGNTVAERREQGLKLLQEKQAEFPLPPSITVDSGGGRHFYWLLDEPFDLREPAARETFECALKGLQVWWEGDNKVVDCARILRVPGTRNFPDQKKRAKGREVAESATLERALHVFSFAEFEMFEHRGRTARAERQQGGPIRVELPADTDLPERVRAVLESNPRARALYAHDPSALPANRTDPKDTSASVFDHHLMLALIPHTTLTRDDVILAAKHARMRAGDGNREKLNRHDYWQGTFQRAASWLRKQQGEQEQPDPEVDYAAWLRWVIRAKRRAQIRPEVLEMGRRDAPRVQTGIPRFDEGPSRGCYELTSVSGPEGVGKSFFLLSTAMASATHDTDPWETIYFNAENSSEIINGRIQRYWNKPVEWVQKHLVRLHRFWVPYDWGRLDDLREYVCACINADTRRVLIVLDSLNTVCDKMSGKRESEYFALLREMQMWLQDIAVESKGAIAAVVASELNKEGALKGGKLNYAIACGFSIKKTKDKRYELSMHKSRDTKLPEPGLFTIDGSRFVESSAPATPVADGKRTRRKHFDEDAGGWW